MPPVVAVQSLCIFLLYLHAVQHQLGQDTKLSPGSHRPRHSGQVQSYALSMLCCLLWLVHCVCEALLHLQAVQHQLEQAKLEHAAVLSQLRGMHSVALEEVRHLKQQRRASPSTSATSRRR